MRLHCSILTEACSCALVLAYFAGKIAKNRLVCKNAVALAYYGSCRLLVMGSWWGHSLAGIVDCPTSHPLVKSSLEGARRTLARPVQPKEPLSVDTVCKIADHYISSSSLAVIRFRFIPLVGFAGFFRMDEIRNLSVNDVSIGFIPKRKNDQYREGHTSLLARSRKATCPVSITEWLLKLLSSSSELSSPLVRRIVKTKSKEYFHVCKGVSYTALREEFRKYNKPFVDDIARYGTHSIKSGTAFQYQVRHRCFFVKRSAETTRMASTEEEFRQVSTSYTCILTSYLCCFTCESISIVFELFTQRTGRVLGCRPFIGSLRV